jgi:hypothetical protein
MRSKRWVCWAYVVAVAWTVWATPATADMMTTIWSEDFSGHPNLSSGNWHSNIAYNNDPASIGAWDTSDVYAHAVTDGTGSVGYTASNAQYMFTAAEKTGGFGPLYDWTTDTIGGGSVNGTLYVCHDSGGGGTDAASARMMQLRRGSTTSVEALNSTTGNPMTVGKLWGPGYYGAQYTNSGGALAQGLSGVTIDGITHTFVAKIDFAANANDAVTVWIDPSVMPWLGSPSGGIAITDAGDMSFDSFLLRACNQGMNGNFDSIRFVGPLPEPGTLVMSVCGAAGLLAYAWRNRK